MRVKANVTVDEELWHRCKALSQRFDFINWSEIAEGAFREILILFDKLISEAEMGKDSDQLTESLLLYFQSHYHQTLSDVYKDQSEKRSLQSQIHTDNRN